MDLYSYKYYNDQITRKRNEIYKNLRFENDDIPTFLKTDLNGNRFLQHDNKNPNDRLIIYFSILLENICFLWKLC
jgi:hypothetical protein